MDTALPGGPRRQKYHGGFKTKAQAVEALARLKTARADATYVEPNRKRLGDYVTEWLAARTDRTSRRRSRSTVMAPQDAAQCRSRLAAVVDGAAKVWASVSIL